MKDYALCFVDTHKTNAKGVSFWRSEINPVFILKADLLFHGSGNESFFCNLVHPRDMSGDVLDPCGLSWGRGMQFQDIFLNSTTKGYSLG